MHCLHAFSGVELIPYEVSGLLTRQTVLAMMVAVMTFSNEFKRSNLGVTTIYLIFIDGIRIGLGWLFVWLVGGICWLVLGGAGSLP